MSWLRLNVPDYRNITKEDAKLTNYKRSQSTQKQKKQKIRKRISQLCTAKVLAWSIGTLE